MKTLLIYLVGFVLIPIIAIALNKKFPQSIWEKQTEPLTSHDKEERVRRYFFVSFIWPIAMIYIFWQLLDYWYLKNNSPQIK